MQSNLRISISLVISPGMSGKRKSAIMDFFGMLINPSNDNMSWNFFFQNTSSAQNICFPAKNREKIKSLRFYLKNESLPPKIIVFFLPRQMKMDFDFMCLMCANTFFFCGREEKGPMWSSFKPFLDTTFIREKKSISS